MADTSTEWESFGDFVAGATTVVVAAIGLLFAFGSAEPPMVFHGLLLALAGVAGLVAIGMGHKRGPLADRNSTYFDGPIKVAVIAAIFWGIAGFVVEGVAGLGGMAVVYRAREISLGRLVALKVLSGDLAKDPTFRERFRREAGLVAALPAGAAVLTEAASPGFLAGLVTSSLSAALLVTSVLLQATALLVIRRIGR